MDNLPEILPQLGSNRKTTGGDLVPNSRPDWQPPNPHQLAIAKLTDRLFDLLPPLDVGDPAAFQAATVVVFSAYPLDVVEAAVPKIACSSDRPTLKLVKAVCDELFAPIERQAERDRAAAEHRKALPPPRHERTPEQQARIDALVAETRKRHGLPAEGKGRLEPVLPPSADAPINAAVYAERRDGKHAQRVEAELAAKRQRRENAA